MNHLERFQAVMNFQPVDRLPRIEWASWWDQTLARWRREGLHSADRADVAAELGLDPYRQYWFGLTGPDLPVPAAHGAGIIADMDDYERLRPRLLAPVEAHNWTALRQWTADQAAGRCLLWITFEGFFWMPRRLLGIERHLVAFYDQPELMHRINNDLAETICSILDRFGDEVAPAFMTFAEDMSYNLGPMLSRGLFDEFLAPYYRRVVPRLAERGITVFVDTDGDMTAMIPWLQAVGVQGSLPLERQAGVDGNAIRRQWPDWLMIGHFDKMTMPRGEDAMRSEFDRLGPLIRSGGYIPSVDHQTPPGVSLEQYRIYIRLLSEATGRSAD